MNLGGKVAATVEIFGSAVVVVGSFNPPIFTPDWLANHNLIGNEDADKARQGAIVITRQLSRFETDWFIFQVTEEQFSITSNGALTPSIKDLAIGALSLLPHTPVRAVGVNFFAHYKITNVDEAHKVGDALVPKDIWKQVFPGENRSVGMVDATVVVEPYKRGDKPKSRDKKQLSVQPSAKVPGGIFLSYNDHHEMASETGEKPSVDWCLQQIEDHWQPIWEDSKRVFEGIIEHAIKN